MQSPPWAKSHTSTCDLEKVGGFVLLIQIYNCTDLQNSVNKVQKEPIALSFI